MKTRHLIGALVALAPVIVLAQVGTTPSAGNAAQSMRQGAPAPDGLVADAANTDSLTTDSLSPDAMPDGVGNVTDPTAGPTVAVPPAPDPMAPARTTDPMKPKPRR